MSEQLAKDPDAPAGLGSLMNAASSWPEPVRDPAGVVTTWWYQSPTPAEADPEAAHNWRLVWFWCMLSVCASTVLTQREEFV